MSGGEYDYPGIQDTNMGLGEHQSEYDYSDFIEKPSNEIGAKLAELVGKWRTATEARKKAEVALKKAKDAEIYLEQDLLPAAMADLGTDVYRDRKTGLCIEINEHIFPSITEINKEKAFSWMDQNKFGGMIKSQVITAFNRDQRKGALALKKLLAEKGFPDVKIKQDVHWKTLQSWAKKQLKAGKAIPDSITIERKNIAKVKEG